MSSSKLKKVGSRRNFWTPLQIHDDIQNESDIDSNRKEQSKTEKISPIKVLTQNRESVLNLINSKGITNYLNKKMSIGVKIICESLDVYNKIIILLRENKYQFFNHEHQNSKPFKVVLRGLDYKTDIEVKNELNSIGLKCVDVKAVKKTIGNYVDTIYIVCFENGSIKLNDLRKQVRSLFRTIITWEYQRKIKNKPVQCRRCQMFGHGERGCNVIERCANCAEKHKTIDCKSATKIQCANCGNNHKSTDADCPARSAYTEMREKLSKKPDRSQRQKNTTVPNDERNFPNINNNQPPLPSTQQSSLWRPTNHSHAHNSATANNSWRNISNSYNNNSIQNNINNSNNNSPLFSEKEFMELTVEMISRLSSCKTREDQFSAITQLAFKFVYCNVK